MTAVLVDAEATLKLFRDRLSRWWPANRREFPWRAQGSPYGWLIAEVMLRRTRAAQVAGVYERFIARFPTPKALAKAGEAEVAELLRPLGLAWRVPAFRLMAQEIVARHQGQVPRDREALLSLPGVGDYVADAVRCFGFGESVAVIDANTVRVAARYFGFSFDPESRRRKPVKAAVTRLLDAKRPAESNLALLDFAALICQPLRPLCDRCPMAINCAWALTR